MNPKGNPSTQGRTPVKLEGVLKLEWESHEPRCPMNVVKEQCAPGGIL